MNDQNVIVSMKQIAIQLRLLCQAKPIPCKKINQSQFGTNSRIIHAYQGAFQYYNTFIGFKQGDPTTLNDKYFKASVKFEDIHELEYLPKKGQKKDTIAIIIPQVKINYNLSQKKTHHKNYLTKWTFLFDFDVKKFIEDKKRELQKNRQLMNIITAQSLVDLKKDLQRETFNQEQKIQNNQQKQERLDLQQYAKGLRKMKNYLKLRDKLQSQTVATKNKKKKQQTIQNIQPDQDLNESQPDDYPIKGLWIEYCRCYDNIHRVKLKNNNNIQQLIDAEGNFLKIISLFRQQSELLFKQYIDQKLIGWKSQKTVFMDFEFYQGIWIKLGDKNLNQQFQTNLYLADIIFSLKQVKGIKFKIPLMNLCKYKSFKGLILMDLKFDNNIDKRLAYTSAPTNVKFDAGFSLKIKQSLNFLQRVMNIKTEQYINDGRSIEVPLGKNVHVFQYNQKKHNIGQNNVLIDSFYYIVGAQGIFPVDFNYIGIKQQSWIRPELNFQFRDKFEIVRRNQNPQLLSQAFYQSKISIQQKNQQDLKVATASKFIEQLKIKELVQKFNNIELIIIDSLSIKRIFEEFGINIRYLSRFLDKLELPYLKEMFVIQAIARTIKFLYKESLKELLLNTEDLNRRMLRKQQKNTLKSLIQYHNNQLIYHTIDFLNLIFGIDEQTEAFWKIIISKCKSLFNFDIQYPVNVKPGCLLHAIIWHCNFILDFNSSIQLFKRNRPFKTSNWKQFGCSSSAFNYPSLQLNKIIRQLPNLSMKQKEQLSEKLGFNILKFQLYLNYLIKEDINISLAKMNNYKQLLQKASSKSPLHPIQLTFYIQNKTQNNFHRAVQILKFALPDNHPLYISLYNQYSSIMQPELLNKAKLLAAIKSLGEFHPKTTQIYTKLFKNGHKQFQIKANRLTSLEQIYYRSQQYFDESRYDPCLKLVTDKLKTFSKEQIQSNLNLQHFLGLLTNGLLSANRINDKKNSVQISKKFSEYIQLYKVKDLNHHYIAFKGNLVIKMSQIKHTYYLYKMVLLTIHIEELKQGQVPKDQQGLRLPTQQHQAQIILKGLIQQYYSYDTHYNWINKIINKIMQGLMYFNYLNDLFTRYEYHLNKYNQNHFKQALGYLHLLVKLFGQKLFTDNLYEILQRQEDKI